MLDPFKIREIVPISADHAPVAMLGRDQTFRIAERPLGARFDTRCFPVTSANNPLVPGAALSDVARGPIQRRKRASKPKVRTGCTTCKIRRIKCDETKPACKRCTSTGRTCDGYEFPRESPVDTSSAPLATPPKTYATWSQLFLPSSMSVAFPGDTQERRIFHRFQVCTIPVFSGGSESGFWESLVLKVGQQETVVRHAIIALGTLHEDYQARGGKYSKHQIEDLKHQNALQLYGKALRNLNDRLYEGNRHGAKLAIISSILFACFEVLRRNNMAAVIHYQAGMRELVRQISLSQQESSSPSQASQPRFNSIPRNELDELLRVFARYDIQACTFSKARAENLDVHRTMPSVPPTFLTLAEVKRHLDNLLITVYQFIKSDLGMYRYWKAEAVPASWLVRRDEANRTFEAWLNALEEYLNNPNLSLRAAEAKSLLGLRLQIKVAIIMLKTCIDCGPEMSFDVFEAEFEDIVSRVELLADALQLTAALPLDNESTSFTMELGIIHPLFFVTTKCRHWTLRRRAINALRRAGREGVWEGPIMALVGERMLALEEDGVVVGQIIPERNRLHDIKKNVDYESGQVLVEATRSKDVNYENWEVIRESIRFD